jgi:hypothetical protein
VLVGVVMVVLCILCFAVGWSFGEDHEERRWLSPGEGER